MKENVSGCFFSEHSVHSAGIMTVNAQHYHSCRAPFYKPAQLNNEYSKLSRKKPRRVNRYHSVYIC